MKCVFCTKVLQCFILKILLCAIKSGFRKSGHKLMHQVCLSMFDVFYRCSKLVSINLGWRATYGSMISSHDHIINVFDHIILEFSMPLTKILNVHGIDTLWIFESRVAIMIMRDQHQHHNCEEYIMTTDV